MNRLAAGQAAGLVRRLAGPVDGQALHAALAADGKGAPPLFIQLLKGYERSAEGSYCVLCARNPCPPLVTSWDTPSVFLMYADMSTCTDMILLYTSCLSSCRLALH